MTNILTYILLFYKIVNTLSIVAQEDSLYTNTQYVLMDSSIADNVYSTKLQNNTGYLNGCNYNLPTTSSKSNKFMFTLPTNNKKNILMTNTKYLMTAIGDNNYNFLINRCTIFDVGVTPKLNNNYTLYGTTSSVGQIFFVFMEPTKMSNMTPDILIFDTQYTIKIFINVINNIFNMYSKYGVQSYLGELVYPDTTSKKCTGVTYYTFYWTRDLTKSNTNKYFKIQQFPVPKPPTTQLTKNM